MIPSPDSVDSVSLPQIISTTAMDAESVNTIRDYANELMVYVFFPLRPHEWF